MNDVNNQVENSVRFEKNNKIKDIFEKNKKTFLFIGIALIIISIAIMLFAFLKNDNIFSFVSNPDGEKFASEYENLNDKTTEDGKKYPQVNISNKNVFKYSTLEEVLNVFNNKGDAVIYFGYAECLYCRNAVQVLYDTAADTNLDAIYYLNVKNDVDDSLLKVLGDEFKTEDGQINAPLVLFVVDGQIVSYNIGTLFSQENPYIPLDDSQVQGLSEIYRYGINDVLSSIE